MIHTITGVFVSLCHFDFMLIMALLVTPSFIKIIIYISLGTKSICRFLSLIRYNYESVGTMSQSWKIIFSKQYPHSVELIVYALNLTNKRTHKSLKNKQAYYVTIILSLLQVYLARYTSSGTFTIILNTTVRRHTVLSFSICLQTNWAWIVSWTSHQVLMMSQFTILENKTKGAIWYSSSQYC